MYRFERTGIPLNENVVKDLNELSKKFQIEL
jgi:hypothetical protein